MEENFFVVVNAKKKQQPINNHFIAENALFYTVNTPPLPPSLFRPPVLPIKL